MTDNRKLDKIIADMAEQVYLLRSEEGLNQRAIIALLHDSTKISKRTIKQVLDGLVELGKYYCEKDVEIVA